ncbi:MAG: ABC transporter permease [Chlorobium sp.]|jgi:simple sugar transport system permease protein|nr:ABC transporter permease [Chlorobium sp.]
MHKKTIRLLVPLLSITTALLCSTLFIILAGEDPFVIYNKIYKATFASGYGTGQVIFKTTTLIFTGLAVALPFKVRLFNIGGEGQLLVAAFASAVVGALLPAPFSPLFSIPLSMLAGMSAGAFWALLAGVMKVRFGINEVISTIMLNFIAQGLTGYLLTAHFAVPSTEHTAPINISSAIPHLDALTGWFRKSPANLSTVAAVICAVLSAVLLFKSRFGYEMRAVGLQPEAAEYAGISKNNHILGVMALAGALAGLGASNLVLGYKQYYESGLTTGAGFTGIAVALLAGAHPLLVMISALFFAFLEYGGLTVNAFIPKDIFMMIEAIIILLLLSFSSLFKNRQN